MLESCLLFSFCLSFLLQHNVITRHWDKNSLFHQLSALCGWNLVPHSDPWDHVLWCECFLLLLIVLVCGGSIFVWSGRECWQIFHTSSRWSDSRTNISCQTCVFISLFQLNASSFLFFPKPQNLFLSFASLFSNVAVDLFGFGFSQLVTHISHPQINNNTSQHSTNTTSTSNSEHHAGQQPWSKSRGKETHSTPQIRPTFTHGLHVSPRTPGVLAQQQMCSKKNDLLFLNLSFVLVLLLVCLFVSNVFTEVEPGTSFHFSFKVCPWSSCALCCRHLMISLCCHHLMISLCFCRHLMISLCCRSSMITQEPTGGTLTNMEALLCKFWHFQAWSPVRFINPVNTFHLQDFWFAGTHLSNRQQNQLWVFDQSQSWAEVVGWHMKTRLYIDKKLTKIWVSCEHLWSNLFQSECWEEDVVVQALLLFLFICYGCIFWNSSEKKQDSSSSNKIKEQKSDCPPTTKSKKSNPSFPLQLTNKLTRKNCLNLVKKLCKIQKKSWYKNEKKQQKPQKNMNQTEKLCWSKTKVDTASSSITVSNPKSDPTKRRNGQTQHVCQSLLLVIVLVIKLGDVWGHSSAPFSPKQQKKKLKHHQNNQRKDKRVNFSCNCYWVEKSRALAQICFFRPISSNTLVFSFNNWEKCKCAIYLSCQWQVCSPCQHWFLQQWQAQLLLWW